MTGSSRLQGYLIHESLVKKGYRSHLIFEPRGQYAPWEDFEGFLSPSWRGDLSGSVSIIQKLRGENTDRLITWLKASGSHVVYVNCDVEDVNVSWKLSDQVLATTETLCEYHRKYGAKHVSRVREPYEFSSKPMERVKRDENLQVLWFGYGSHWSALLPWKRILEEEYEGLFRLVTCSDHPEATHRWSLEIQRQLILESDIAIFPTMGGESYSAKSPNRLVQAMACGLPSIVGTRPSYKAIVNECSHVLEATDESEFRKALKFFTERENRHKAALHEYQYVVSRYSPEVVTQDWINQLGLELVEGSQRKNRLASLRSGLSFGRKAMSVQRKLQDFGRKVGLLRSQKPSGRTQ